MFEMMLGLFFVFCVFFFLVKLGIGILKICLILLFPILVLIVFPIIIVPAMVIIGGGVIIVAFFKLLF